MVIPANNVVKYLIAPFTKFQFWPTQKPDLIKLTIAAECVHFVGMHVIDVYACMDIFSY